MKDEPWIGNCPKCHTAYRTDPPEIPVRNKLKLVRCLRHDCNETVEFSPIGGFPEEEGATQAKSEPSETPKTDALANEIYARGIRVSEIRMLQHARKLERERNTDRELLAQVRQERDNTWDDLQELREAIRAFRDAKGRFHTQLAAEKLINLLPAQELPAPDFHKKLAVLLARRKEELREKLQGHGIPESVIYSCDRQMEWINAITQNLRETP